MTKGLLKSMFLHTGILMVFMYGAEIFKKNKRFEIYEIPLDIVDISEKTVNKTELKKKVSKKNKKQIQAYYPPSPKTKPKPPEFALKEKEKKSPVKNNKKKKSY